jgi:hypothetical protein
VSKEILLSKYLTLFSENKELIEVEGDNLGECLNNFVKLFPKIKEQIFTGNGVPLPYVEIQVNKETVGTTDMSRPMRESDKIYINAVPRC